MFVFSDQKGIPFKWNERMRDRTGFFNVMKCTPLQAFQPKILGVPVERTLEVFVTRMKKMSEKHKLQRMQTWTFSKEK